MSRQTSILSPDLQSYSEVHRWPRGKSVNTMERIPSRFESGLLHITIPLAFAITRLSNLKNEVVFAKTVLEDLIGDFRETQRQLSSLQDFLQRAEFSRECHNQCHSLIQNLHAKVNKLTNLIDCVAMKLKQKGFFRRSKHRLSLVSKDLGDVHWHIQKINGDIAVIRQEMMLEIAINSRNENRGQNQAISEEVQNVNKNLTGTDAKRIRKIYSKVAVDLMDPWSFLVVNPPQASQKPQPQPAAGERNIQLVAPLEVTEVFPSKFKQLDVDITLSGQADLADVEKAFSEILERSTSEQFVSSRDRCCRQTRHIAELP